MPRNQERTIAILEFISFLKFTDQSPDEPKISDIHNHWRSKVAGLCAYNILVPLLVYLSVNQHLGVLSLSVTDIFLTAYFLSVVKYTPKWPVLCLVGVQGLVPKAKIW